MQPLKGNTTRCSVQSSLSLLLYPMLAVMNKKKDDSVTQIIGRIAKKSGESEENVQKVLAEYRDNARAGRHYKVFLAYIWSLTKEILSKWYVILMILLGGGASFWDSIKSVIMSGIAQ